MTGPGRPRIAEHAESQRLRILEAAQCCFIEQGFHAATIASIAETAGMSAGLIYRYFESKQAIVLAIIERQLETRRRKIAELRSADDIVSSLSTTFRQWQAGDPAVMSPALYLEMSAHATREPRIAGAVACSDRLAREDFRAWLARRPGGGRPLTAQETESRALLVQCLVDGLAVRATREPSLDAATVRAAINLVVGLLE